ncbi:hypothetical protein RN001_004488 [Aquatica leii]|uniref:Uncharacterized protein n=1 Tax=Aquatica leii TaxID=1421715 RepID=A0AAN7PBF2_9COLE|nr:hypothetical protein RN001_004488 [Aquatica leii]
MDYRYKPRGPPRPPRQPPLPPYMKKWENNRPQRNPVRPPRPIPLEHSIPNFGQPQVPPVLLNPSVIKPQIPVRNIWQNQPQTQFKVKPEKPFQFSAPITTPHEYDYQIQTNNIPTHAIPIKQVGEKGPIHTIPAPNLSPADRPAIIEEYKRPSFNFIQQQHTAAPNPHQYQVTEANELLKSSQKNREHQYFPSSQTYSSQIFNNPPETQSFNTASVGNEPVLSQQEIYQLINSHINHKQPDQQHVFNNYEILPQNLAQKPLNLQPTELSLADYKAMIGQSQPSQSSSQYLKELQQSFSNPNAYSNNAMFNYKRHASNADQILENFSNDELQIQQEPYVQELLDLNQEIVDSNNRVEPKADIQNKLSEGSVYYTNLPNRQAAEALASLQNAGKLNLKQFKEHTNSQSPLNIYVPDAQQFTNFEVSSSIRHNDDSNDESEVESDFSNAQSVSDEQDEINESAHQQSQRTFGRRAKPKHQEY